MGRSRLSTLTLALAFSTLILISSLVNQGQSQIEDDSNTLTLPQVFGGSVNSVVQIGVITPTLNATIEDMPFDVGFVYDKQGHIVTSLGAVPDEEDLLITFLDGTTYNATLIGSDPFSDVAVLSAAGVPEDKLVPLPLGNSTELQIGERVAAIGNPFGISGVLTEGVIGKLGAMVTSSESNENGEEASGDNSTFSIPDIIVSDVPINPGNSGGPLLNMEGEVIGMNVGVFGSTGEFAGISISVPSNTLNKIVPSLISDGSYAHPWLGVSGTDITPEIAKTLGLKQSMGFLVTDITSGSPADKAGIQGGNVIDIIGGREIVLGGDIIVAIDNNTVRKIDDILGHLEREKSVGSNVKLSFMRDGEIQAVNATLAPRPEPTFSLATPELPKLPPIPPIG